MKYGKYILLAFIGLMVMAPWRSEARHIIGGEITYECLGVDTVRNTVTLQFEIRVYRDCFGGGALFDPTFNFGIYYKQGSVWQVHEVQTVNIDQISAVDINTDNPCVIIPPTVCVEKGVYRFVRELPIRNTSYMVAYQRCCRNNTISNIWDPGDQGAAYTIEITAAAQESCNNSPKFRQFPPIVICVDQPLQFDHGAVDTENDDLVYEFCTPLEAGGQLGATPNNPCPPNSCECVRPDPSFCAPPFNRVAFRAPLYTSTTPLGGNPVVSLDRISGLITGTPREQGQFVVGVCVSEYRAGVLMSVLRRDFQFNVTYCEPTVVAALQADEVIDGKQFVINSCGNNTVTFVNRSYREQYIDDYHWEFDLNGSIDSFDTRNATVTFPGIGQYTGTMILNRGNAYCSDTAEITVNIYPDIEANYAFQYDTCIAGPVVFEDFSESGSGIITDWEWDFGDGGTSTQTDPQHLYVTPGEKNVRLRVTDINECKATTEKTIRYFPVPPLLIIEPSTFIGCTPATIEFINLSIPIDETYDIHWEFGDGNTGSDISPTHTYTSPGLYSIRIEVTSPIGCYTEAEFPNWIRIEPSPDADFSYSPDELTSFNKTVRFQDQSTGAASWQWSMDDEAVLFDRDPVYTFQDTGRQRVELIVVHPSGCPDTIVKYLDVRPVVTYHLPNAFTPNGDGTNDNFFGVGILEGYRDFSMSIWNRWGEMVFYSEDPAQGWNGTKMNNGTTATMGVYVYLVEYTGPRGERVELKGYVTLIR